MLQNIYLIFHKMLTIELNNGIKRSVKASLPVHVLTVSSLHRDVNLPVIVTRDLLVLASVEPSKAHDLHHLNLLVCLPLKVLLREYGRRGGGGGVRLLALAGAGAGAAVSVTISGPGPRPVPLLLPLPSPLPRIFPVPPASVVTNPLPILGSAP